MGKNVLLLNMSKLQGNNVNFYYSDMDVVEGSEKKVKRCFYRGTSSLEPGSKNILWRLGNEGKYIDKIIILATPETQGEGKAVEVYKKNIEKFLLEGEDGGYTEAEIIDKYGMDVDVNVQEILELVKSYRNNNFSEKINGLKINSKICREIEDAIYADCTKEDSSESVNEKNPGAKEFEEYLCAYSNEQKAQLRERLNELLEKNIDGKELENYEFLIENCSSQGIQADLGEKLEKSSLLRMKFLSHCYAKQMYEAKKDEIIIQALDERNKDLDKANQQLWERNKELVEMIQKLQKQIDDLTHMKEKKIKACIRACLIMEYYDYVKAYRTETNVKKHFKDEALKEFQKEYAKRLENNSDFFQIIDMESLEVRYEAIPEVVETITSMKKSDNEEDEEIKLYLDMQGGARTAVFVINAVVNMLQSQKHISLERSYAITFSFDNWINEIRDETMANHVLELVSGMDEFLNYGKANKFQQYYKHYKKMKYGDETVAIAEDALINNINEIAETISLCNVNGMYAALDSLKNEILIYNAKDEKEKEPIFKSFANNLESNYSKIWNVDRKATDVIQWCMEKELYQQALTVCESKFPIQLVDEGIVYYCRNQQEKGTKIQELSEWKNSVPPNERYKLNDVDHFFIKNYKFNKNAGKRYKQIMNLLRNGKLFSLYNYNRINEDGSNVLQLLLKKYFGLCDLRNNVNHGSQMRNFSKADFNNKVKEFTDCYNAVISGQKRQGQILKIVKSEVDNWANRDASQNSIDNLVQRFGRH